MGKPTSTRVWYDEEQFIDVEPPLAWDDIKLDTPYRINLPAKDVTQEGMREVKLYVYRQTGYLISPNLSSEWLVTNKSVDNGLVGTMPKRISKYLYKSCKLKISSEMMAEIGNIARQHTVKEDIFVFDITQQLDWSAGDFGDNGSCYFDGEYNHSRLGLINAEQYALRLFRHKDERLEINRVTSIPKRRWACRTRAMHVEYNKVSELCPCRYCMNAKQLRKQDLAKYGDILLTEDVVIYRTYPLGAGYGRAWLVEQDNNLVTFNAYGEYQLMQISRILSTIMGKSYRKTNIDHSTRDLYLNGDGCVIGNEVSDLTQVMLTFKVEYPVSMSTCEMCNTEMPEEQAIWHQDVLLCDNCYTEHVAACYHCEEYTWTQDMSIVGYELYCPTCYSNRTGQCEECQERFHEEELSEIETLGGVYCEECKSLYEKDLEKIRAVSGM